MSRREAKHQLQNREMLVSMFEGIQSKYRPSNFFQFWREMFSPFESFRRRLTKEMQNHRWYLEKTTTPSVMSFHEKNRLN